MRVQVRTKFCFLCVLTFLFNQSNHCHGQGHSHQHGEPHHTSHTHSDLQISEVPYVRGATLTPESKNLQGLSLEEEQHFYIQQLFRRYGQKGRLDFHGFQSLLFSLGLGEVKVVGVDHEDLGHDHVVHLDLLDMLKGHHSHSPSKDGHVHVHVHGHGHGHGHGHSHDHGHGHTAPKHGSHHPPSGQDPTRCSQQASTANPTAATPAEHEDTHDHGHDHDHHDHGHEHNHDHDHGHDRDHDYDHTHDVEHNHDHTKVEVHDNKHDDGHVQDTHEKEHKHDHSQVQSNHKDLSAQPQSPHNHSDHEHDDHNDHKHDEHGEHQHSNQEHGEHEHEGHSDHSHSDIHEVQTGTDISPIRHNQQPPPQLESSLLPQETSSSPTTIESRPQKPRKPARMRGHRRQNRTSPLTSPSEDHDHHSEHSHDDHHYVPSNARKNKREAPGRAASPTLPAPILPVHQRHLSHQHEECLNLTQLLVYYGLNPESSISPSQFTYLCPALLYQIDSRVCIQHYHHMDEEHEALEPVSSVWVWLWGFVSITIISLLSLLGVLLVPILKQSCFKFLLTFLVALAVGTLSGDALLHLLPHSQGHHDHSEGGEHHDTNLVTAFDGVWKGLTALAGIYLLFIIEHCIGMFKHYKSHRGMKVVKEEGKIGRKLSDHKLNRRSDAEWLHLKPLNEDPDSTTISCDNGHNDTQLTELQTPNSPINKMPLAAASPQPSPGKENGRKKKHHSHEHSHGHGHSHGGNCHSDKEMKDAGIASIAWMVIMGDGMHNFSDGLAIGAAFSANLTGGISTSVAVFCHELPHELGDFAVLLKAGMTVKQAIVYNLLSALMAYVGMLIGTAVGQYTHNVTNWIFAITAGMFLYVALVDMLPEMLHGDSEDHKRCQFGHFILQNLGMLTGFAIMLLIAIFEDQIVFDFGF